MTNDLTGTGTPRSGEQGTEREGGEALHPEDDAIVTGATARTQPAFPDDVDVNRSGHGGSGGPVTDHGDPAAEEGSGSRSLDEMLGNEDRSSEGASG